MRPGRFRLDDILRSWTGRARAGSPPEGRQTGEDSAADLPLTDVAANRRLSDLEFRSGRDRLVSAPWHLHLSMADACNIRCIMCRVSQNPGEFELHLPDQVDDNIDALLPLASTCHVYGAEPFFKFGSSGLKRLLDAAQCNEELSFVTTTNGLLVNEHVAGYVFDEFSRVRFSVDSPDPETYEFDPGEFEIPHSQKEHRASARPQGCPGPRPQRRADPSCQLPGHGSHFPRHPALRGSGP